MAFSKYCDFCGWNEEKGLRLEGIYVLESTGWDEIGIRHDNHGRFDLCPECMLAARKVFCDAIAALRKREVKVVVVPRVVA